jgi:hypothetical protein
MIAIGDRASTPALLPLARLRAFCHPKSEWRSIYANLGDTARPRIWRTTLVYLISEVIHVKPGPHESQVLSCRDTEHLHGFKVLSRNDEFRDGSLFAVIQEKIRQRVS